MTKTKQATDVEEKLLTFDVAQHAVELYQIQALRMMNDEYDFSGKRVLEIGGSNLPRELVFDCLHAAEWVCVDYLPTHFDYKKSTDHYAREVVVKLSSEVLLGKEEYTICDGKVEDIPSSFFSYFDTVVSLCAFEHFSHVADVLQTIKNCLKQSGEFFTYFGPIWSCSCGHHCWVTPTLNFNDYSHLPEFCHLLFTPSEMERHLSQFYPSDIVQKALAQIYISDRINRLFYEDYVKLFETANFSECHVVPAYEESNIDHDVLAKLRTMYPHHVDFTTYNIYAHCKI